MSHKVLEGLLAATLVASATPSAPADDIRVAEPRPMMTLSDELTRRYGYLLTYEDAPADPTREAVVESRANGRQFIHPAWRAIIFHVEAQAQNANSSSASTETKSTPAPGKAVVQLGPNVIDPLIRQYNSSGNPGRFSALYDGDYAHIVQDGRMVDGKLIDFEPILSTIVPASLQEGTCWDLVKNLFDEVQQYRKVTIVNAFPPVNAWDARTCSIRGHDLPARQVLKQLLDQIAVRPRISPNDRFLWTLVYDPNENAYFFGARTAPRAAEPAVEAQKGQAQAQTPATGSKALKQAATPPPAKKN